MNPSFAESKPGGWLLPLLFGMTIMSILLVLILTLGRPRPQFPTMPDFGSYGRVEARKAAFIDYLTPIVEYFNDRILMDRKHLKQISMSIAAGAKISWADIIWLQGLAEQYAVEWNADDLRSVALQLKRRVDIIPVPLVLVQAAKESSWGQSRFAVEAHNLFGQWCFHQGCGVQPDQRPAGARHEVRRFKTAGDSVRSYLHNINTHSGYADLRRIRQRLREQHQPVTAGALADGLLFYSERRGAYVEEIKLMIAQYRKFQNARVE